MDHRPAQDTGDSRGFAFIDFPSVEYATALLNSFPGSAGVRAPPGEPPAEQLVVDGRVAYLEYSRGGVPAAAAGGGGGGSYGNGHGSSGGGPSSMRCDWVCTKCGGVNFARRDKCYQVRSDLRARKTRKMRVVRARARNARRARAVPRLLTPAPALAGEARACDGSCSSSRSVSSHARVDPRVAAVSPAL